MEPCSSPWVGLRALHNLVSLSCVGLTFWMRKQLAVIGAAISTRHNLQPSESCCLLHPSAISDHLLQFHWVHIFGVNQFRHWTMTNNQTHMCVSSGALSQLVCRGKKRSSEASFDSSDDIRRAPAESRWILTRRREQIESDLAAQRASERASVRAFVSLVPFTHTPPAHPSVIIINRKRNWKRNQPRNGQGERGWLFTRLCHRRHTRACTIGALFHCASARWRVLIYANESDTSQPSAEAVTACDIFAKLKLAKYISKFVFKLLLFVYICQEPRTRIIFTVYHKMSV